MNHASPALEIPLMGPDPRGGFAAAQYNLGVMYGKGWGVLQDYAKAVKWYCVAAENGYAEARYNLGVMYAEGRGVPQDFA